MDRDGGSKQKDMVVPTLVDEILPNSWWDTA